MRKLKTLLTLLVVSICAVQSAWAQDEVSVTVTLPEPNSLSTEILKQVEDVKVVTKLVIASGAIGDLDWKTMQSMTALKTLDLSAANCEAIPDNQFYASGTSINCKNLVTVKLPSNLKTIGTDAFSYQKSLISVEVPSTVVSIGSAAFLYCENLEECSLENCLQLTTIPSNCFNVCTKLHSFTIPSSVTTIEGRAFCNCQSFTSNLPAGISSVGYEAFRYAAMTDVDITLPEDANIGSRAFSNSGIKSITLPTTYYQFEYVIDGCENLKDITFKSPTMVKSYNNGNPENIGNITLHVPSHLIDLYKADTEWSKYKSVVAISPAITAYTVQANLNLNYAMRMEGNPSLFFRLPSYTSLNFTITGNTEQRFNNFTASAVTSDYYDPQDWQWTMIMSECPNVIISGDFVQRFYVEQKRWCFLSLPFDFKVGDVTAEKGAFVIRTYDGQQRNATNANSGNWKNTTADDVIKAGTGFILQASEETWVSFKAKSGGTNNAFKTASDELKIPLLLNNSNAAAAAANTGWNMVGNPWMTFYNVHKINYTAPFCYYNHRKGIYETVSIADDDYALAPCQPIFLQCPAGITEIGFPADGRQLTSEITDQNGAPAFEGTVKSRLLLDVQVSAGGELKDKTRIVMNEKAEAGYEIGRDASKFMSSETKCPQVYTLDGSSTQYAINERPEGNGTVRLGMVLASGGTYEISAIRNDIGRVILTDNVMGISTDLSEHSYSFDAEQGTIDNRFTLTVTGYATGISEMKEKENDGNKTFFNLNGQRVDAPQKGIYVVNGKKVIVK